MPPDYISTLKGLQRQLAGIEQAISNIDLVTHLLATLTVDITTQQMDVNGVNGQPTIESITSRLIEHENSLTIRNAKVGATTNTAGTPGNALAAGVHRRGGHGGRGGLQPYPNQRKAASNLKCYYCLKEGHRERDCSLKQNAADYRKERQSQWSATAACAQFTVRHDDAHICDLGCTEEYGL